MEHKQWGHLEQKDKDRAVAEEALEEDRYRSEADVHAACICMAKCESASMHAGSSVCRLVQAHKCAQACL